MHRRQQWRRACRESVKMPSGTAGKGMNLMLLMGIELLCFLLYLAYMLHLATGTGAPGAADGAGAAMTCREQDRAGAAMTRSEQDRAGAAMSCLAETEEER